MKTTINKVNGRTQHTPETAAERAALEYLNTHRPLFAVAEPYILQAFVAGMQLGKVDGLRDGIKQLIRDAKAAASQLQNSADELDGTFEDLSDAMKTDIQNIKKATKKGN